MTFEEFAEQGYNLTGRETQSIWREIAATYHAANMEINRKLSKTYEILSGLSPDDGNYYNELLKYGRYDKLLGQINEEYTKAAKKAGILQINASKVSITNNYYRQQYAANFGAALDVFSQLPSEIIEIATKGTNDVWQSIRQNKIDALGETYGALSNYQASYGSLTDILLSNRTKDLAKMKQIITQGLVDGSGVREVSKNMSKMFGITINAAQRIYRTETHRNRALGDFANYNYLESEGIDMWRQIVSTLDNRTRPQSAEVDGEIDKDGSGFTYPNGQKYKVPGATGVPAYDINDREKTVSYPADINPLEERRGRNPATGKNEGFGYKTFKDWAKEHGLKRNIYGQLLPI